MQVAVFGLGYVGFTTACCIASQGHRVVGMDANEAKREDIAAGRAPISEPGVQELFDTARATGLFRVEASAAAALEGSEIAMVCVGTPSGPDGAQDMRFIAEVTRQIGAALALSPPRPLTLAYRSTLRPGSIEELVRPVLESRLSPAHMAHVELVCNPEFLREATAVADYFAPPRIVIGTAEGRGSGPMEALYAGLQAPVFRCGFREAEFTKFVDNTWHAAKVAFANEIGRLCLRLGLDAKRVHEIFVSDTRLNISPAYLRPGGAFGGSCLPKDVRALQHIAADCGANTHVVDALLRSNEVHKHELYERAVRSLAPGASVLLVGLAFKPGTDDLRESPNVDMARKLLAAGYRLSVYDPALDAGKLVGANLGHAFTRLPRLSDLLVSRARAEAGGFDLVIAANATIDALSFSVPPPRILDIGVLA
ncbi:nucleotide sugar dehydrogenase (plasmid) [Paroceanicella profunda]|uniref:UDP-glucose 6-dehydrogenase n=1 Tax=Paroceanicella profunda TaxID=2579971 RepID=A0A5B8FJC4_9RHOB|nr:nucleotide sugar dehydrogenase [Paroceanicella profunda]QDL94721.1 nucleotide sugar dehydrogenase [Paroceanicella profunda]